MTEPVLVLSGIQKAFGALKVTDGVSLSVAPGELHALIGPNGAGKTTLVHQISGMLRPDTGSIRFRGQDITGFSPERRARAGLARTFQITSTIPSLSVLENVALGVQARAAHPLALFRNAARDETLNAPAWAAIEAVGLTERAHVLAGQLSHGEKRALEIAMALTLEPARSMAVTPLW